MKNKSRLEPYRERIQAALEAGYTKTQIARYLKIPRSTLREFIESWGYESINKPDEKELQHILGNIADASK